MPSSRDQLGSERAPSQAVMEPPTRDSFASELAQEPAVRSRGSSFLRERLLRRGKEAPLAIIGSGPYGLSLAAHLSNAGVPYRIFGVPMDFWSDQMPAGMFLRSSWDASHIDDPTGSFSLDAYQAEHGTSLPRPIPLTTFVDYGRWFQNMAVPEVDQRRVTEVRLDDGIFGLTLDDESTVDASRVVIATGLTRFPWIPDVFQDMAGSGVYHAAEVPDPSAFKGRRVAVVGLGQSAVETAVLIAEAGAEVELIGRRPTVRWLNRSGRLHQQKGFTRSLLYPPTDVGPPVLNQVVSRPNLWRKMPKPVRDWVAFRSIRPAAASWLTDRSSGVKISTGLSVIGTQKRSGGVHMVLDDGTSRDPEVVVLATGYRVDLTRFDLIEPSLLGAIRTLQGYPLLGTGFESSVPGLHFVGAPSAMSFGPLMRFVSGTRFASPALTAAVARQLKA